MNAQRWTQPRQGRNRRGDRTRRITATIEALAAALLAVLTAIVPAARAVADSAPTGGQRAWPITGALGGREPPLVLRGFEPPPHPWSPGHRGVDLAAAVGTPVRAAAPGKVTFAGTIAGQGVVSVELTGSGTPPLRITYEPVRPSVRPGDLVEAGGPVGVLASGAFHCPATCLHWGLLRGDVYLDPLSLLPDAMRRLGPSRLLPVDGIPPPGPAGRVEGASGAGRAGVTPAGVAALAAGLGGGARFRGRRGRLRAGPWIPRHG